MNFSRVTQCRVCGNEELVEVLDLGVQALTGVFPDSEAASVPTMPLILVKCHGKASCCHLLQLAHTFDLNELYGENYGYRSGLNRHIETHLKQKVEHLESIIELTDGDLVLDIGSNDGTTLGCYSKPVKSLVGIDPTAQKFRQYYPKNVEVIADFFSKAIYSKHCGATKAKVVTSFSMFYDLSDPVEFARDVADIMDDQGVWVLEQSYMPAMLQKLSYDTICHEHLEYYGLKQLKWIMSSAGLDLIDVSFNEINGGSFSVTVAHPIFNGEKRYEKIERVLNAESQYQSLSPFQRFATQIEKARTKLLEQLLEFRNEGKKVVAIGASTKGNVILQYCDIDTSLVSSIGEVNLDKFGKFTPGTCIPIQEENAVLEQNPDYLLVLPWHLWRFFESSNKFSEFNLIYPILDTSQAC